MFGALRIFYKTEENSPRQVDNCIPLLPFPCIWLILCGFTYVLVCVWGNKMCVRQAAFTRIRPSVCICMHLFCLVEMHEEVPLYKLNFCLFAFLMNVKHFLCYGIHVFRMKEKSINHWKFNECTYFCNGYGMKDLNSIASSWSMFYLKLNLLGKYWIRIKHLVKWVWILTWVR